MMSVEVDETAGDLPVRDVGLMRGGLMPTAADSVRDVKPWKKSHILKMKDPQRLFKVPREQLEEHCLRLIEENGMLRQHAIAQEQKIRRMSTRLMRLQQARPGETAASARETDMDETIQELEARVSKLEGQKRALQNKLQLARQHIMDMGGRTHYRLSKGRGLDGEGAVRRAAQTAPPRYGPALEDTRDNERFRASVMETQQSRVAELELAALRDTLRDRDREMEGAMKDMRKQQADMHRQSIKENVDVIRLQKQLSERSAALRVAQDKFNHLQKTYENQLEECQRSLKETNASLLEKVEELSVQLKEERQRGLSLETNLNTANLSQKTLEQFKDRISDLEGERALLKESYDALLDSTFSAKTQQHHPTKASSKADRLHQGRQSRTSSLSLERGKDLQRLEEMLRGERDERHRLEEELDRLREQRRENKGGVTEERRDPNRASFHSEVSMLTRDKRHLEQELEQYREQVVALQDRLDSIPKEFEMSIEELSETLLQIKVFRMQQESRDALRFLRADGKARGGAGGEDEEEEPPLCVADLEASLAETSLELSKTRELLLLQHRIHNQLQEEINVANQRLEREKEESRRRLTEKDKLLAKRILQINTLQAQLKDMAYSPAHYKRTMPVQYTWLGAEQEVVPPVEDDAPFSQLRPGEALLEIHLKGATFTPEGLRTMALVPAGGTTETETLMEEALEMDRRVDAADDMVTFCTYGLLDFEVHSTPLVSGATPNYGFTSRYALAARDLGRLGGQGARARLELHQATGGVRFVTRGGAHLPLMGAVERRGERVGGCVNVTGSEGEMVGVVDFWVRLHPPAEALMMDTLVERGPDRVTDRRAATQRTPAQQCVGWEDSAPHEVRQQFDYGVGIPNELLVVLERCVGLQARWPGLLPDAYLTYRLYDLPPHSSPTAQCAADPLFNDATTYPLAVTKDLLHYLRSGSLWVYLFDDSDEQTPPAYLAKTPVPLVALATGKEIRGDYVLRDAGGAPQGMLRMLIKWRYPFQTAEGAIETHRGERRAKRREDTEETPRPIAKPRLKKQVMETTSIQKETKAQSKSRPPPIKVRRPQEDPGGILSVTSPATPSKKRSPKRSPEKGTPRRLRAALSHTTLSDISQVSMDEEQDGRHSAAAAADSETSGSTTSSSTQSDIVVIPTKPAFRKGDKLRVEILSLTFGPSSNVALDQSVQRVYVEYRLLGVPMETTETPMSLRKPEDGEEIHYNFTRVIYVDGTEAAPLRQYLYTMLEGTDPSQGRLKFTVVSEPMDEEEECVDVGHSFLELQELLLTGNDVSERQIDILSVDEDREVIGQLKVSLEAAKALTGIYWEFQQQKDDVPQQAQETLEEEEEEEEEGGKEEEEEEKGEQPQAIVEEDSDYY